MHLKNGTDVGQMTWPALFQQNGRAVAVGEVGEIQWVAVSGSSGNLFF